METSLLTPKSRNVGFGGEKCWGTRTGHRHHFPRPIAGGIASNLTHQLPTTLNVGLAKPLLATNGCSNPSNWGRGDLQSSTFSNNLFIFGGKMILVMEMSHVCNESQPFFGNLWPMQVAKHGAKVPPKWLRCTEGGWKGEIYVPQILIYSQTN